MTRQRGRQHVVPTAQVGEGRRAKKREHLLGLRLRLRVGLRLRRLLLRERLHLPRRALAAVRRALAAVWRALAVVRRALAVGALLRRRGQLRRGRGRERGDPVLQLHQIRQPDLLQPVLHLARVLQHVRQRRVRLRAGCARARAMGGVSPRRRPTAGLTGSLCLHVNWPGRGLSGTRTLPESVINCPLPRPPGGGCQQQSGVAPLNNGCCAGIITWASCPARRLVCLTPPRLAQD